MATHNQARIVGFIKGQVTIVGNPGDEKAFFTVRTVHRDVDFFYEEKFEDIMIFYDGASEQIMNKIRKLEQFDIVDIKGVFNILTLNKSSICPYCGRTNIKYFSSSTFIYPIHLQKLNALYQSYEHDEKLPEALLVKHYKEISNQIIICGTVVKKPTLKQLKNTVCSRYPLGVNRKYYIKTQGEITADYPYIYTFGQQAEDDERHLIEGSTVLVDAFIRTRAVHANMTCESCGESYQYADTSTEFVPYSIEYLKDYLTDEDIAMQETADITASYNAVQKQIFGNC